MATTWHHLVSGGIFGIIAIAVIVVGILAFAFCSALLIHHVVSTHRRRRRQERTRRVSGDLAPYLVTGEGLGTAAQTAVQRYGRLAVAEVLRQARNELRGDPVRVISAVLAEIGEVARLKHLAQSKTLRRRLQGIRGLGECGGDEPRRILVEAVSDSDPEVRRAARDGLLSARDVESIRVAIRSYLEDYPIMSGWRGTFYGRLASVAPAQLTELVERGELTGMQEKLALEALGDARHGPVRDFARVRLTSDNPELRATAARVLGKLRDQDSRTGLLELLGDEQWFVRAAAARAFERITLDAAGVERLASGLRDQSWWVRANSASALAVQGPTGVDLLVDAIKGDDHYATDAALAALGYGAPPPAVVERLGKVWNLLSDKVRDTLAVALESRGEVLP